MENLFQLFEQINDALPGTSFMFSKGKAHLKYMGQLTDIKVEINSQQAIDDKTITIGNLVESIKRQVDEKYGYINRF